MSRPLSARDRRDERPQSARSRPGSALSRPGSARSRPGSARSARYPETNFSSLYTQTVLSKEELSREAAAEQGAELATEALLEKFQEQAEADGVQLFASVRLPEDAWSGTPPLGPKPLVTSSQQSVPQVGLQAASAQLAAA